MQLPQRRKVWQNFVSLAPGQWLAGCGQSGLSLLDLCMLLLPPPPSRLAAYYDTAQRLVDALREAISTDLSDAEEREVSPPRGAGARCRRAGRAAPGRPLTPCLLPRARLPPLGAGAPCS